MGSVECGRRWCGNAGGGGGEMGAAAARRESQGTVRTGLGERCLRLREHRDAGVYALFLYSTNFFSQIRMEPGRPMIVWFKVFFFLI